MERINADFLLREFTPGEDSLSNEILIRDKALWVAGVDSCTLGYKSGVLAACSEKILRGSAVRIYENGSKVKNADIEMNVVANALSLSSGSSGELIYCVTARGCAVPIDLNLTNGECFLGKGGRIENKKRNRFQSIGIVSERTLIFIPSRSFHTDSLPILSIFNIDNFLDRVSGADIRIASDFLLSESVEVVLGSSFEGEQGVQKVLVNAEMSESNEVVKYPDFKCVFLEATTNGFKVSIKKDDEETVQVRIVYFNVGDDFSDKITLLPSMVNLIGESIEIDLSILNENQVVMSVAISEIVEDTNKFWIDFSPLHLSLSF